MAHVASYLVLVHDAEQRLVESLLAIGEAEASEAEVLHGTRTLALLSRENLQMLEPVRQRYESTRAAHAGDEPEAFFTEPITEARSGPIGLLRDLQDLLTLVSFVQSTWTVVEQGAKAMKDEELKAVCEEALERNEQQQRWCKTHIKVAAPQALLMAS